MPIQTKTNSYSEISNILTTLQGVVSVQDIIDLILRIPQFEKRNLEGVDTGEKPWSPNDNQVTLSELYVDIEYQRIIRLMQLINKITKLGFFDITSAGAVDVAIRPSWGKSVTKKYVWDGLRRCIMAGLCGYKQIKVSNYTHDLSLTSDMACQKVEARFFETRNTQEKMKPEEIWKAQVVQEIKRALDLLDLFKSCKIDCLGLVRRENPNDSEIKNLVNGFSLIDTMYFDEKKIARRHWEMSSNLIRQTFPSEPNISSAVFCGIAHLLHCNKNAHLSASGGYFTEEEIEISFREYGNGQVEDKKNDKIATLPIKRTRAPIQNDLKPCVSAEGKKTQSIAYNIVKEVLNAKNDLGEDALRNFGKDLHLNDTQIQLLEEGLEI